VWERTNNRYFNLIEDLALNSLTLLSSGWEFWEDTKAL
jgi:hypothetical protein